MTASTPTTVERLESADLHRHRDELLAVYTEVYEEQLETPFFSVPRYWDRLVAYASRDGFSAVAGRIEDQLIGYALGYALPQGSRWWSGLRDDVEPALLTEDGRRTFALNEIMVREAFRRRGYAKLLHDALLAGRPEERATLLVLPDNIPARSAYRLWGWYKLGRLQPFNDAPVYDAMVLDLK
ncbi:GNAT family N-acetyltransferase [Plantactinospora sp. S1510]|uniref:GNAT family N-acetyltransferase n=1 Tax=Plantactinospora alkalitolerans TaxID=2789879 RepID=A0ABS0GU20_9ACTN|nr:GNAT family N-acetyltransferase [Plantactinospora alkalitolerans]MBF9129688.1 GNAT family N-acetyltransferase [Plantactinospora alkalitolerans]